MPGYFGPLRKHGVPFERAIKLSDNLQKMKDRWKRKKVTEEQILNELKNIEAEILQKYKAEVFIKHAIDEANKELSFIIIKGKRRTLPPYSFFKEE